MSSVDRYRWWLVRGAAVVLAVLPALHVTGRSPWELTLLAAAGLTQVEVGVRMWRARPDSGMGPLMVGSGLIWLLATWDRSGLPALGPGGLLLNICYDPMQLHCALIIPAGRLATRTDRLLAVVGYAYWPATIAAYWLLRGAAPLTAGDLERLREISYPAIGVGLLIFFVARYRRATPVDRHAFAPFWTVTLVQTTATTALSMTAYHPDSWTTALYAVGSGLVPVGAAMSLGRSHRRRLIEAGDAERQRVERNVHDGVQQRLLAAALLLRQANRTPTPDRVLVARGAAEVETAIAELRALVRGMNPPELVRYGLSGAVAALADRAGVPMTVDDRLAGAALPEQVAVTAYFVVVEAVANIGKYAHAHAATATLARTGDRLVVTVCDDGAGGAGAQSGGGLAGLRERVESCGGTFDVTSPAGKGTTVRASLPLGGGR
jgi:signal transduction histidine kinase